MKRMNTTRASRRGTVGQTLLIFAFTAVVLFGVLGLAVDAGADYYVSSQVERAASNGALAAVPDMQGTLATYQAAADQAFAIAQQNGFGVASFTETDQASTYPFPPRLYCNASASACGGAGCTVTNRTCGSSVLVECVPVTPATSPVSCAGNKIKVTVTTVNGNFFGGLLGIKATTVSRSSTSEYLPPLQLGQPGGSIGADIGNLGTGNNQYLMRLEAWGSQRAEGDAFAPDPADPAAPQYASNDIHVLSGANEAPAPVLPSRGGYNYLVYIPGGKTGHIEIYNPAFAPDAGYQAAGATQNFHEQDSFGTPSLTTANKYPVMQYTVYRVNNVFNHSYDTVLSQAAYQSVIPTHAAAPLKNPGNPSCSVGNTCCPVSVSTCVIDGFTSVSGGAFSTHAAPMPTFYHGWVDVGKKDTAAADGAYNSFNSSSAYTGSALSGGGAGTYYRVRVDAMTFADGDPENVSNSAAHKGYSGRVVVDSAGIGSTSANPSGCGIGAAPPCPAPPCTGCTFGAINDFAIYTPIDGPSNPAGFDIALMQVPPEYAGKSVTLSIFDPGDVSNCQPGPFNTIKILRPDKVAGTLIQPSTAPSAAASWVLDVGPDLSAYFANPASIATVQAKLPAGFTSDQAVFGTLNSGGGNLYNGHWLTMQVQVPTNYTSIINVADPTTWYWSMQYTTNCIGSDTITVDLSYGGSPVHLIP